MVVIRPSEVRSTISRDSLIGSELKREFNDIKDRYFRSHATYHHIYRDNIIDRLTGNVKSHNVLKLLLFGVNLIGEKRAVVLDDVDLYMDVNPYMLNNQCKVNKSVKKNKEQLACYLDTMKEILLERIQKLNRSIVAGKGTINGINVSKWQDIAIKDIQVITSKDIKLYRKNNVKYIRIYFYNNVDRCNVIDHLREIGFKTYSNERCKNDIANIIGRIYDFKFGHDIDMSLAKPYTHPNIKVSCSILSINDVRYVTEQEKSKHLLLFSKRRLLIAGYDIEVHGKLGKEVVATDVNDKIKTINISLFWNGDEEPVQRISICYGFIPDDPSMITITCDSQEQIIDVFADLFDVLQPDYELDFNGGEYDWVKIRTLLAHTKGMAKFWHTASCYVPVRDYTQVKDYHLQKALYPRKFKISADTIIETRMIAIPGCIMYDIRNPLRKMYKSIERSNNLKTFLAKSNLPPKKDMSVARMFHIYDEQDRLSNHPFIVTMRNNIFMPFLMQIYNVRKTEYDAALVDGRIDIETLNTCVPLDRTALMTRVIDSAMKSGAVFGKMVQDNIDALFDYVDHLVGYYDVRTYCDRDAESCYRLFNKNFWYYECAEMASLANICISDAHWKADGMKVVNFICKYANKRGYIIDLLTIEPKEDAKYPGAYVVHPKTNLYKFRAHLFYKMNVQSLDLVNKILDTRNSLDDISLADFKDDVHHVESETTEKLDKESIRQRILHRLDLLARYQSRRNKKRIAQLITAIGDLDLGDSLLSQIDTILYIILELNELGFPIVALDFSSLYPNIERTYNLSPECIIRDPEKAAKYEALGWKLHKISFKYGTRDVLAWSLLWDPQGNRVECVYGSVLGDIFDMRKGVKSELEAYPIEWMRSKGLGSTPMFLEAQFMHSKIDGKQRALKIIMNTMYGKTGDTQSPLFMKEIAGGTTCGGQDILKTIYKYIVEKEGISPRYGDTDSLYQKLPFEIYQAAYDEFIEAYEANTEDDTITEDMRVERHKKLVLKYSTEMVQLTMRFMPGLSTRVSEVLYKLTGVRYLSMAYEEVLYPTFLVMKKKYGGVPHEKQVSFAGYKPFIKGLIPVKAGYSPFAKGIITNIIQQFNDIYNEESPEKIVKDELRMIFNTPWKVDDFVATIAYKPNKLEGNPKVKTFITRMRLEGHDDPLPYSRFPSVVVRKYPFTYDKRGRKHHLKVGDKLEYPHIAKQRGYEIDIFHYVGKSILAELAGFICMEPCHRIKPRDLSEECIAEAYQQQLKSSKKYLKAHVDQYNIQYAGGQGAIFKHLYKEIYKNYVNEFATNFDNFDSKQFSIAFNINYIEHQDIFAAYMKNILMIAKTRARTSKKRIINNIKSSLLSKPMTQAKAELTGMINAKSEANKAIIPILQQHITTSEKELYSVRDDYLRIYKQYNSRLEKEIMSTRLDLNIERNNDDAAYDDAMYKYITSRIANINYCIYVDDNDIGIIERILTFNNTLISANAHVFEIQFVLDAMKELHTFMH